MSSLSNTASAAAVLLAFGLTALPDGDAAAATCIGSCGSSNAQDGVVTVSPAGAHQWISTNGGTSGAGTLPGVPDNGELGETDGSLFTTNAFSAAAGDVLSYYFNYITSDGAQFTDYAWAQLQTTGGDEVATLLTARTHPTDSIIPGFDMPDIDATLDPASVPIIPGGPVWSPLGGDSGACWDDGCGYTDWVHSTFTIAQAGTYVLAFGVTNWNDQLFDSGLAFGGIQINDVPINPIPLPAALPLLIGAIGGLGLLGWRQRQVAI